MYLKVSASIVVFPSDDAMIESMTMPGHSRRKLVAFTDGAARGNPGPSASGYAIFEGERRVKEDAFYNGKATNNIAEYKAVVAALEWCVENTDHGSVSVSLNSDSELVVRQLRGAYKVKSEPLRPLHRKAMLLSNALGGVEFANLRRSNRHISAVDKALNALLDSYEDKQQAKTST